MIKKMSWNEGSKGERVSNFRKTSEPEGYTNQYTINDVFSLLPFAAEVVDILDILIQHKLSVHKYT